MQFNLDLLNITNATALPNEQLPPTIEGMQWIVDRYETRIAGIIAWR
jgi:hypothetical protein